MNDSKWMRKALALAGKGWGRTSPNPMVGAVLVKSAKAVGSGWHQGAGKAHAETEALADAGRGARGATLYVTLEPCSTHGRTPPCTTAIIAAGVKRVVIGSLDPNPDHNWRAVEILRQNGVEAVIGVEKAACRQLNEAFFCWVRYRRPFVVLKLAMTADGRIATHSGESKWISCADSRGEVQHLRQWADAVLVGGETIRRDNPQLTVRTPPGWQRQPLRIVASRSGRLGRQPRVLKDGLAETRVVRFTRDAQWHEFMTTLGDEGITALLVEGGGETAARLLRAGVVDKVALFIAPLILGGTGSRPAVGGANPPALIDGYRIRNMAATPSGDDILLTGYLSDVHRFD